MIYELWEDQNATTNQTIHTIKIRYNGNYRKIPFCDWQEECTFEQFYGWYSAFKDPRFLSTCGVSDPLLRGLYSTIAVLVFFILVLGLFFVIRRLKKPYEAAQRFEVKNEASG